MISLREAKKDPRVFFDKYSIRDIRVKLHPDAHIGSEAKYSKVLKEFENLYIKTLQTKEYIGDYEIVSEEYITHPFKVFRTKKDGEYFILHVPISENKRLNRLTEKAFNIVKTLDNLSEKSHYGNYLHKPIDKITDNGKTSLIFEDIPDTFTVKQLKELFPEGLEDRHIGWITNRLLTGIGYINHQGILHGALVPENCLIDINNHMVLISNWIYTCNNKAKRIVPSKYKDWYKAKNKIVDEDITIALQTIKTLMQKKVNKKIKKFLDVLIHDTHIQSAWSIQAEFEAILEDIFGQPKFIKLTLPKENYED